MAITRAKAKAVLKAKPAPKTKAAPKAKAVGKKRSSNNSSTQIKALKSAPSLFVTTQNTQLTASTGQSPVISKAILESPPRVETKPASPPATAPTPIKSPTTPRPKPKIYAPASASASTWHNAPNTSIAIPDNPAAIAATDLFTTKRQNTTARYTARRGRRRMNDAKWRQFTATFPNDRRTLTRLERWRAGAPCADTDVLWACYDAYRRAQESRTAQSEAVKAALLARLTAARRVWDQHRGLFDEDLAPNYAVLPRTFGRPLHQARNAVASSSRAPPPAPETQAPIPSFGSNTFGSHSVPNTNARVGDGQSLGPDPNPLGGLDFPYARVPIENPAFRGIFPVETNMDTSLAGLAAFEPPRLHNTNTTDHPATGSSHHTVQPNIMPNDIPSPPVPYTSIPNQVTPAPLQPVLTQSPNVTPANGSGSASATDQTSNAGTLEGIDVAQLLSSVFLPSGEIDPDILAAFVAFPSSPHQSAMPSPVQNSSSSNPQLQAEHQQVGRPNDVPEPERIWDMDEGDTQATLFDWDSLGMMGDELVRGLGMK